MLGNKVVFNKYAITYRGNHTMNYVMQLGNI